MSSGRSFQSQKSGDLLHRVNLVYASSTYKEVALDTVRPRGTTKVESDLIYGTDSKAHQGRHRLLLSTLPPVVTGCKNQDTRDG